jgi:hypothetical protein
MIFRGSAYDLRQQDKAQRATLCFYCFEFTIQKTLFIELTNEI